MGIFEKRIFNYFFWGGVILLLSSSLFPDNNPFKVSKYPLKGRSFKNLSIDYNRFSSDYANLKDSLYIRITEGVFHTVGRILDNQCWYQSPGNFCDYNFLPPLVDPGQQVDSTGASLHNAGGTRTVPYERENHGNAYCANAVPSGATYNGDSKDVYPDGDPNAFWYSSVHSMSITGAKLWIFPNGWWEEKTELPWGHAGSSYSVQTYTGRTGCSVSDVADYPKNCNNYYCEWCSNSGETNGPDNTSGRYCYPGDDKAIYLDAEDQYFDSNASYSVFRDNAGSLIPSHKGYTFPYHYYYPNPSPYNDGSTWDGANLTIVGFCPTGSGGCGSYPESSFTLRITVPHLFAELGIHDTTFGTENFARLKADTMDIDAYIKLYVWDDSTDTTTDNGCSGPDEDCDHNSADDSINDPQGLDADVDVTNVNLNGGEVKADGNIGSLLSAIANAMMGTIEDTLRGALSGAIKGALTGAFPIDMNNMLGNPWNTGTGLLDVGIYPGYGSSKIAKTTCSDGSTSYHSVSNYYDSDGKWMAHWTNCDLELPTSAAVEPILFNSNCTRDQDLSNPEPTDFFGICTLYNHNGTKDEDQQFDMNNGTGADYFGPPLIYKANTPPVDVTPPSLDTIQPLVFTGTDKNAWGNFNTVLYDANHNGIQDDGSCSDSSFTDNNNDGIDDNNPNCTRYSMAIDIHYNFLRQALYAVYSSGLLDFALSATDSIGSSSSLISGDTLKPLLNIDAFKSFMPVLANLAKDGSYVAIKVVPRGTPTALTGYGNYDNAAGDVGEGGTGTYDIAMLFPGVDFEFWFEDKNGNYKRAMTLRWNLLVGTDIEFYKGCHPDDPAAGTSRCTDPDDPEYIPGYLMVYAELNNPTIVSNLGISTVEVVESEIDISTNLLKDQFTNILPVLLSTFLQAKLEMRMPRIMFDATNGMTMDIGYIGPEGPSASGATKGDYFGVYLNLIGSVNLFSLMGALAGDTSEISGGGSSGGSGGSTCTCTCCDCNPCGEAAPKYDISSMYPDTEIVSPVVPGNRKNIFLSAADYKAYNFSNKEVSFSFKGSSSFDDSENLFYTYRIDNGLWHPPTKKKTVEFHDLLEGRHVFEVASIHNIGPYQIIDSTPAKVEFYVDTVPPEISFIGGNKVANGDSIIVSVKDYVSDNSEIKVSSSIDGSNFSQWSTIRNIKINGLEPGLHKLVVKAEDEAGNISEKGLIFEVVNGDKGFGCSSLTFNYGDMLPLLLLLIPFIFWKKELIKN